MCGSFCLVFSFHSCTFLFERIIAPQVFPVFSSYFFLLSFSWVLSFVVDDVVSRVGGWGGGVCLFVLFGWEVEGREQWELIMYSFYVLFLYSVVTLA